MMTATDAERIAEEWIDGWNRRDLEAILAHYADEIALSSPLVIERGVNDTGTIVGKVALRKYFGLGLQRSPDLHFELDRVLIGVESIALCYRREGGRQAVETMTSGRDGKVTKVAAHYTQSSSK